MTPTPYQKTVRADGAARRLTPTEARQWLGFPRGKEWTRRAMQFAATEMFLRRLNLPTR